MAPLIAATVTLFILAGADDRSVTGIKPEHVTHSFSPPLHKARILTHVFVVVYVCDSASLFASVGVVVVGWLTSAVFIAYHCCFNTWHVKKHLRRRLTRQERRAKPGTGPVKTQEVNLDQVSVNVEVNSSVSKESKQSSSKGSKQSSSKGSKQFFKKQTKKEWHQLQQERSKYLWASQDRGRRKRKAKAQTSESQH